MRRATIAALEQINRTFYRLHAAEFSATRRSPWAGWRRVVDAYRRARQHGKDSILDVGCGNGRLAAYLEQELGAGLGYLGVDASLSLAASGLVDWGPGRRLLIADGVTRPLPLARRPRFDLIAVFGVLHHVPCWERRRSLLVELAGLLRPGGLLAVSFWQFATDPRLAERLIAWTTYNRSDGPAIDVEDLETGDCLLRWGEGEAVRYCHFADTVEAADLTGASGLERIETFAADGADGRLNLYHLLRRPLRPH